MVLSAFVGPSKSFRMRGMRDICTSKTCRLESYPFKAQALSRWARCTAGFCSKVGGHISLAQAFLLAHRGMYIMDTRHIGSWLSHTGPLG